MAVLALGFLRGLSLHGAERLLLQEGYVKEKSTGKEDAVYDRKFLYPYSLYDCSGEKLDCIYYIEYCDQVTDDEYADGRMTWETVKAEWTREA